MQAFFVGKCRPSAFYRGRYYAVFPWFNNVCFLISEFTKNDSVSIGNLPIYGKYLGINTNKRLPDLPKLDSYKIEKFDITPPQNAPGAERGT